LQLREIGITAERPWFFPSPDQYREMLTQAGFEVVNMTLIPRPTPLPGDVGGWLRTFAQPYTNLLPESQRDGFIAKVVEKLRPSLCDEQGNWTADYVRLRFAAVKPSSQD
ncbi:MAG: hypothetical protein ACK4VV_15310, partial [Pseudomonas sp.]